MSDSSDASGRKPIDASTLDAARIFLSRIAERYSLHEAILFGSRARGTHGAESDADIAVVLDGREAERSAAALDMAGIAFDVFLETGILVEALPIWREEIEHRSRFSNPTLIENIRRDGVRL
jgi:uncharacterized protein